MRIVLLLWACIFIFFFTANAIGYEKYATGKASGKAKISAFADTALVKQDSLIKNAIAVKKKPETSKVAALSNVSVSLFPASSLQQILKGQAAGLHVQEFSGEPGTYQYLYIRGASNPILSIEDIIKSQPLIIVDGIPIVSNEHPFAYDIQLNDFSRIGPSTNLLSGIDLENIESIAILKDMSEYALYGPKAANGVVIIKTKLAQNKKLISFNSYVGLATRPNVSTFNGSTENKFRQQFYDRYANPEQIQNYAAFLKDSLNSVYYGPSNWTDSYYRNAMVYGLNASVTGGSDRANFRFAVGNLKSDGVADDTGLSRYNANFSLNIKPVSWMTVTTSINGSRLDRTRNRYNRDRIAEGRYLPDLSQPMSPSNEVYNNFLSAYSVGVDDNLTNVVDGFVSMALKLGKVKFKSTLGGSYSDGARDLYNPTTLLETVSFGANYFGTSQRLIFDNVADYTYNINANNSINFQAGQSIQWDTYTYNYAYAYKNGNDLIKVNLLTNELQPTIFTRRLIFRFLDKTINNQVSFFGRANYNYKNWLSLAGLLRLDASSNAQPTQRWFYSPVVNATWNLKNFFFEDKSSITDLRLKVGYGRLGKSEINDRFAQGPQYLVDHGWTGEPFIPSYSGSIGLTRPYNKGYVGYDIPWTYNEQFTAGLDFSFWKNRLMASVDFYSNTTKNQLISVPSYAEYGYSKVFEPGMEVNNTGIDLTLIGSIIPAGKKFQWTTTLNANFNRNKLLALPRGLNQLVIDDRILKVGEAIDSYWILQNEGIFYADDEVPINPATGNPLTFQGLPLKAGDPKWKDINGDYNINNDDKIITGHRMPVVSGGFNNNFTIKNWSLGIDLYYNIGKEILNKDIANRFDFINRESNNNLNAIKEITFWEKKGELSSYPLYNVWSGVIPYRIEQDLFLEDASFVKLRTVSLGYDLTSFIKRKSKKTEISKLFVYATANNLFTLTNYSGVDPELIDYKGMDTGYGLQIPRTFTFGVKMSL